MEGGAAQGEKGGREGGRARAGLGDTFPRERPRRVVIIAVMAWHLARSLARIVVGICTEMVRGCEKFLPAVA